MQLPTGVKYGPNTAQIAILGLLWLTYTGTLHTGFTCPLLLQLGNALVPALTAICFPVFCPHILLEH